MKHESFYIDSRDAPAQRVKHCQNGIEHDFTEAAVRVAFALYLLDQGATNPLSETLSRHGFHLHEPRGTTSCGGEYRRGAEKLTVFPSSGKGDVTAVDDKGQIIFAECKGGIINTTNPGQTSRLRKGLAEVIGQLMSRELSQERHIAVVPKTTQAQRLAKKMVSRANAAGIEIALVAPDGTIHFQ
jgi:hypothetical protein